MDDAKSIKAKVDSGPSTLQQPSGALDEGNPIAISETPTNLPSRSNTGARTMVTIEDTSVSDDGEDNELSVTMASPPATANATRRGSRKRAASVSTSSVEGEVATAGAGNGEGEAAQTRGLPNKRARTTGPSSLLPPPPSTARQAAMKVAQTSACANGKKKPLSMTPGAIDARKRWNAQLLVQDQLKEFLSEDDLADGAIEGEKSRPAGRFLNAALKALQRNRDTIADLRARLEHS